MAQGYTGGNVTPPGTGQVVQFVSTFTGAKVTSSTAIPFDNTVPQITEGAQAFTLAITPSSTTNKLVIRANMHIADGAGSQPSIALFQDATANALQAASREINSNGPMSIEYVMTAGTTSSTTFQIRFGNASGASCWLNTDTGGTQLFGGVCLSSMSITEIKA